MDSFDLILKGAHVYDGTGGPWYRADIGIRGDTIEEVGPLQHPGAKQVVDCANVAVAPGFIDTHSHSDLMVFEDPSLGPKMMQGVTTELLGQDGIAAAPVRDDRKADWGRHLSGLLGNPDIDWDWSSFEEYLAALERIGPGPNMACLLPQGNLRLWVMGVEGKNLLELEEAMGRPLIDAVCDLLVEEDLNVSMILFIADEEDVQTILKHPLHMACTDGLLGGKPHPRLYGAFPRILGHYCRELGILDLPEAIRKMTSAPAARLGLKDRGLVRPGMKADLVVFDPDEIIDTSTYEEPRQHPKGILHVFVNGKQVVREGELLEARAGRVLRR